MVKIKRTIPIETQTKTRVSELLDLLPISYLEDLARDLVADKWVKKLKTVPLFKLIFFSILQSERLSLRVMEDNVSDPLFKALAPALNADEATWGGIRDRLIHVNSAFFQKLYEKVYEMAAKLYSTSDLDGYHIKRFDSTMVASFAHLLEGMQVGNTSKNKTQVKFTTELKDDFLIQMTFHKDQAHLSEETALKEAVKNRTSTDVAIQQTEISVFDKGLKSRKSFAEFDEQGTLFVGRVSDNPRYQLIQNLNSTNEQTDLPDQSDVLVFIQDSSIYLYESSQKLSNRKIRLVQYLHKEKDIVLSFVTNVWDLEAHTIAQIYKMRWDIEVLFRFMKQEMNLTHFVCNDINAIQVMLYSTLITSMLILIYKKKNNIKSYKAAKTQFFKELLYEIVLIMLETEEGTQKLKQSIKLFVLKT
jgi:Transposase DDE domain